MPSLLGPIPVVVRLLARVQAIVAKSPQLSILTPVVQPVSGWGVAVVPPPTSSLVKSLFFVPRLRVNCRSLLMTDIAVAGKHSVTRAFSTQAGRQAKVAKGSDNDDTLGDDKIVINDDIMAQLYKQKSFTTELLSACLGREVALIQSAQPQDRRDLRGVVSRAAAKVTLDAFAVFAYRGKASGNPVRVAIHHLSGNRAVIEAQNRVVGYVYPRARVHGAIDTCDAMADATNAAVARSKPGPAASAPIAAPSDSAADAEGTAPTPDSLDTSPPHDLSPTEVSPATPSAARNVPVLPKPNRDEAEGKPAADGDRGSTAGTRSLQRQYDAYEYVSPTVVVTLCNFVPVRLRVADVVRTATTAGADAASINAWVKAQVNVTPTGCPADENLVEVTVVNLRETKSDITAVCVRLQIPNVAKSVSTGAVLPSSTASASQQKRPAFWSVDVPIDSCASPVEQFRPMLCPRFTTAPYLRPMASQGAGYMIDTTLYVFVYLPLFAGPFGLSPPQNRWCSSIVSSSVGTTSGVVPPYPPSSPLGGPFGDEISPPEAAARLHRLSVFLRAKLNAIPQVVLDDPTLKE